MSLLSQTQAGASPYQQIAINAALQYGLPPNLLIAQLQQESSFNPNATNGSAQGIAQFIPSTAAQYGVSNPYDPSQAIYGAAAYDADLLKQNGGNYTQMLQSYGTLPSSGPLSSGQQNVADIASQLDNGSPAASTSTPNPDYYTGDPNSQDATNATALTGNPLVAGANAAVAAGSTLSNNATDYLIRGATIATGIVFIAIGLIMFRPVQSTVVNAAKLVA